MWHERYAWHDTGTGAGPLRHEGGYNAGLTPFCGLFALEPLSGERTEVEDPFLFGAMPGQELQPHQAAAVAAAAVRVVRVPA